ncbi:hypothetical protein [Streptomyces olindensis]|uniref:hypothetical protein n=1 Tax=Streptomyces olindensis TaxID=358823 RepID=UPI0033E3F945
MTPKGIRNDIPEYGQVNSEGLIRAYRAFGGLMGGCLIGRSCECNDRISMFEVRWRGIGDSGDGEAAGSFALPVRRLWGVRADVRPPALFLTDLSDLRVFGH